MAVEFGGKKYVIATDNLLAKGYFDPNATEQDRRNILDYAKKEKMLGKFDFSPTGGKRVTSADQITDAAAEVYLNYINTFGRPTETRDKEVLNNYIKRSNTSNSSANQYNQWLNTAREVGFDREFYLQTYPDVNNYLTASSRFYADPLEHFIKHGQTEKRSPNFRTYIGFDEDFYRSQYPDIAQAGVDPFEHYMQFGIKEGRFPNAAAMPKPTTTPQEDTPQDTTNIIETGGGAPETVTETVPQTNYQSPVITSTTTQSSATTPSQTTYQQPEPTTVTETTAIQPEITTQEPLETAGLSAVPQQVTYRTSYTGTPGNVPQSLLVPMGQSPEDFAQNRLAQSQQGSLGVRLVNYVNQFGSRIPVTEVNGQPMTAVPAGYRRETEVNQGGLMRYAEGGMVGSPQQTAGILAKMFGYRGPADSNSIQQFLAANPAAAARMGKYREAMTKMAGGRTPAEMNRGGVVGYQTGGLTELQQAQQNLLGQAAQPIQQAVVTPLVASPGQFIPSDAGQTTPIAPFAEAAKVQTVEKAAAPTVTPAVTMAPTTVAPQAEAQLEQLQAQTGQVSEEAQVTAAQQNESAVSQLEAATGTAVMMDNPVKREIQAGELISGSAVDATKVEELNAMTQAATATPSQQATVQGQLEGLMQQFEGGETPAWAAGAMRNAQAVLAARGVGASSMAGQAIIQAAMESALPIAQADAATRAQFESQSLSNRQQAAMLAAQQRAQFLQIEFDQEFQSRVQNASRIADVANMNFTAEQQVALENARAANTMNLQNLSNKQAMVMAEAAALANLDMSNLNNRQQAAVQNAQNFLQMDMANLSNRQQTEVFKSQQMMQALFTDQAAENAAAQFNASSQNQVNQFFAQLQSQTAQFNAAQTNALNQFNAGEVNALREFNSTIQQQRDLFNAQNGLVIAQANAQWRQNLDTLNTAAQNEANMDFARTLNAMSAGTLDQLWQRERDIMNFAFTAAENSADRSLQLLLADKELEAYREQMQSAEDTAKWTVIADAVMDVFD